MDVGEETSGVVDDVLHREVRSSIKTSVGARDARQERALDAAG